MANDVRPSDASAPQINSAASSRTETSVDLKRLEERTDNLERGIVRLIGNVTLATSAASTTVTLYGCSSTSWVGLMPLDSTTATEYGLGTTYVVPAKGSFVINHPNNANTRKYRFIVFGGIRL